MSVFGNIISAIFGSAETTRTTPLVAAPSITPTSTVAVPQAEVDVIALLAKHGCYPGLAFLSVPARKQLAQELHYSGDMSDLASMNKWLHKRAMQKLTENGGKEPSKLLKAA